MHLYKHCFLIFTGVLLQRDLIHAIPSSSKLHGTGVRISGVNLVLNLGGRGSG